ncbi:MAG TPA: ParA family protein [Rhizomicrobium sp.]|jgi:chromosome partitioning protein|nr:ParA family protein [Rhizomicrobium sp.]HEX4533446.1 ParA family protein [Rhizomicrobium sp.]
MYVLVMASQKGGSGKTTLSGHLAVEADKAGIGPVALIDTDPQGSLSHWWNARQAQTPHFAKVGMYELDEALAQLEHAGIKLAVIDTPPAITESISHVVAHADLVIVPTRPSPHDLRAVGATVDIAERHNKPLVFVINAATARARITGEAAVALSQHGTVAPVTVHHRVDFAASMVDGRTVGEVVGKSQSAREVRELWAYVQDRLARLKHDPSLATEFKPQHFAISSLTSLSEDQNTFDPREGGLAATEGEPNGEQLLGIIEPPPVIVTTSYVGPDRRRQPREPNQPHFGGGLPRQHTFGRRQMDRPT